MARGHSVGVSQGLFKYVGQSDQGDVQKVINIVFLEVAACHVIQNWPLQSFGFRPDQAKTFELRDQIAKNDSLSGDPVKGSDVPDAPEVLERCSPSAYVYVEVQDVFTRSDVPFPVIFEEWKVSFPSEISWIV